MWFEVGGVCGRKARGKVCGLVCVMEEDETEREREKERMCSLCLYVCVCEGGGRVVAHIEHLHT